MTKFQDLLIDPRRQPHNLLITGGAGFIGSAFIKFLFQQPEFKGNIVNFDILTYAGNLENLISVADHPRYTFVRGDISDKTLVEELCLTHKIDTIVHFAAESHVDRSIHGPQSFLETNIMGTFHLLEVVRKHPNIRFHHVSTDEVYGSLGETGYFSESTPYQPNSPYSASKAASDHLVRAYHHTYGIYVTTSNCSNNYGPCQFPEKLIPLIILNCLDGKPLPVYGNGTNIRDWLFVDDHAEAIWTVLNKGVNGETYNIGGEAEWKNIDIIHEIIRHLALALDRDPNEFTSLITFVKDRPGHDQRYAIDCSKIKAELDWTPRHTFSDGMKKTIDWYLNNRQWIDNVQSGAYKEWLDLNYASK